MSEKKKPSPNELIDAIAAISVYHADCETMGAGAALDKITDNPNFADVKPLLPYVMHFHFPERTYGNDVADPEVFKSLDTPIGELCIVIQYLPNSDPGLGTVCLFDDILLEELSVADRIDEEHYQFDEGRWSDKTVREVITELEKLGFNYNHEECVFGKASGLPDDDDMFNVE